MHNSTETVVDRSDTSDGYLMVIARSMSTQIRQLCGCGEQIKTMNEILMHVVYAPPLSAVQSIKRYNAQRQQHLRPTMQPRSASVHTVGHTTNVNWFKVNQQQVYSQPRKPPLLVRRTRTRDRAGTSWCAVERRLRWEGRDVGGTNDVDAEDTRVSAVWLYTIVNKSVHLATD